MEKISIDEITTSIQYGFTESATTVPVGPKFLRITDIQEGKVNWDDVPYCVCNEFEKFKLAKGDIVFARTGATTGKSYLINGCPDAVFASYLIRLRVKENIYPNYVYYFFQSEKYWSQVRSGITGSTQGGLNATKLSELEIPMPDYETQIEIAQVLKQADKARQQRKAANALTDQFLQSSFLSLFGDPVKNEKGWELKTLPELAKKEKYSLKRGPFGGALKKEIFIDKGYLVYEQFHAINDDFTMARYFIDENKYQELIAFDVKPGDLIVSCSGVTLGRIAELPLDAKPGIINQALLKISLDQQVILNTIFTFLFRQQGFQDKLFEFSRGSGIPNFPPMTTINSIKFICPPLPLQQQFADIVVKAEQLRQKQRESERELENLFQGLLQRYFG